MPVSLLRMLYTTYIYMYMCVENFNNRHLFANLDVLRCKRFPLYCLDYSQVTQITINGNPPHPGVYYHYCRGSVLCCDSQLSVPDEYIHDRIKLAGLRWVTVMYCSKCNFCQQNMSCGSDHVYSQLSLKVFSQRRSGPWSRDRVSACGGVLGLGIAIVLPGHGSDVG